MEISKTKFIKLKTLVSKSDLDLPNDQIDLKTVFGIIASKLEENEKKWRVIIRLFEQDEQALSVVLEMDKGKYKLLKKIPDKYDLELLIQKDAWWDIIRGELAPMEAFLKDKMHIKSSELGLPNEFFKHLVADSDKKKIIFM